MSSKTNILPYQIESDLGDWPGLAKLVEEMGELNTLLGKLVSNGGKTDYWGDVDLRKEMHDEISDVMAALAFFADINDFDRAIIHNRLIMKLQRYAKWRIKNRIVTGTENDSNETQGRNPVGR